MKWIGRLVLGLLAAVLVAGGVLAVHLLRSMPQLDGQLKLAGLSAPASITRDAADVTHIEGKTALDTWRALGFVHAQERGWQLEFNRRLMRGELSEMLGAATLDTDKLMRTLGIIGMAQKQLKGLSPATQAALQAYCEGIQNAWASGAVRPSPEFKLLGSVAGGPKGQAWSPEDSLGWALMMALDLGGNWGQEFARLSASQVLNHEQLWQLLPPYPGEKPATAVDLPALYAELGVYATKDITASAIEPAPNALAQWSADWVRDVGILEGKGSNNWVVPGSRTVSGKPLLANDPHLALSSPAIWYFAHLKAPAGELPGGHKHPALDVIGATLPGLPFVVLGRTQGVAWGFTNTGPDVQDLYLEQLDAAQPGQYRTPTGWAAFEERAETIRIKGQGDVTLQVRSTRHGPVISDVQAQYGKLINKQRYAISLRWSALTEDNKTVEAGMLTNWAQTVPELQKAFTDNHAPMQSVVMADTLGDVAFQAVGKLPIRSPQNDIRGVAPVPGWLAQYDWTGWLPAAQNPAVNRQTIEAKGWHATANQNILPPGYAHFVGGDWTTPERFDRIEQLLAASPQHSRESLQAIQNDVMSLGAKALLPVALSAKPQHPLGDQALKLLATFDGQMTADSAAALVFNVWADELTRGLLLPHLGAERFQALYGKRHFRAAVEGIVKRSDAFWCGAAGCPAQVSTALDRALTRIATQHGKDMRTWRWGAWHPAISSHKPFGKVPYLNAVFDVRTESAGDLFTVNVGQYWANDPKEPFANRHAASMRAVYDLAEPEQSVFIYQTGQSGHAFDPRSRDMAKAWASGRYRSLKPQSKPQHTLILTP
ncbi:penicillin amidase [Limnohabitans sp. MMS-10A-160]|uniref:penicillin acylase family protein n=1 Tax=unclassified Limnohabitans TaxID=2626134 RepID=UPI000D36A3F5|nr:MULTISPECIES: penicillin acylase family protein [unclassified Limnohabitans]PUE22125.1 penicillin amidase [Limnohabitans sp. MMS-10A-192]PUE25776.1 penicillin amidase [Limnohabitans sp. MMS-10A-160]